MFSYVHTYVHVNTHVHTIHMNITCITILYRGLRKRLLGEDGREDRGGGRGCKP